MFFDTFLNSLPQEYIQMPDVDNNFISLYESPTVAGNIIIKKIDPSRKIPSINDKSFQKFIKKK